MKTRSVFYILIFCSIQLFSQAKPSIKDFDIDSLRFFVSNTNKLQLIFQKSVISLEGDSVKVSELSFKNSNIPNDLNFNSFEVIYTNNKPFFIRKSLGEVYTIEGSQISRLDNSSNLRANVGSAKMSYNDRLFSFFGYGFFNNNNLVLNFSSDTREWNKINPPLDSDVPKARNNTIFHQNGDKVFFLGGYYTDENETIENLRDLYEFDFIDHSFKFLGLNNSLNSKLNVSPGYLIKLDNNKSFAVTRETNFLFDFDNLSYSTNKIFDTTSNYSNFLLFNNKLFYIFYNGKTFNIDFIETQRLIDRFKDFRPIVEQELWSKENATILFFIILLAYLFYLIFKLFKLKGYKKNKFLKQGNYITYNAQFISLEEEQSEIVNFLISKKDYVYLSEVFNLKCFEEYSDSYKKIYVPNQIKVINSLLEIFSDNKGLSISKRKNKLDKRVFEIKLKGELFLYKGWFNYLFNRL